MARGRPKKATGEVLLKSAEFLGWALGGLEREIALTRDRLAALTRQAAKLRVRVGQGRQRALAGGPASPEGAEIVKKRRKMSRKGAGISEPKRRWAKVRQAKRRRKSYKTIHDPGRAPPPFVGGCAAHNLHRHPQRLEDRDLIGRLPPRNSVGRNLAELACDVIRAEDASYRHHEVAGFGHRPARESTKNRARHEPRIQFALIRPARADAADVRARLDQESSMTGSREDVAVTMTAGAGHRLSGGRQLRNLQLRMRAHLPDERAADRHAGSRRALRETA